MMTIVITLVRVGTAASSGQILPSRSAPVA
jgi:hypothetical protein